MRLRLVPRSSGGCINRYQEVSTAGEGRVWFEENVLQGGGGSHDNAARILLLIVGWSVIDPTVDRDRGSKREGWTTYEMRTCFAVL